MRKFNAVFKEKQTISEGLTEKKILGEFTNVYSNLMEQYGILEFDKLNEETKTAFLKELNEYWTEEEGISKKGVNFVKTKSLMLTESSTSLQKRHYLRTKATKAIDETLRQSSMKTRLCDILDEMYKNTGSAKIDDVLSVSDISNVLLESFTESLESLMTEMVYEISDEE